MVISLKKALRVSVMFLPVLLFSLAPSPAGDEYDLKRKQMLEQNISGRGVTDSVVLGVMGSVPRHLFVDVPYRDRAYGDHPLPIGEGQTISQLYVLAATVLSIS